MGNVLPHGLGGCGHWLDMLGACAGKVNVIGGCRGAAEFGNMEFRGEYFNIFNVVNLGLPANILGGKAASTQRQTQFSLKLIY